ncbi:MULTISPECIES: CHAT domain-containing protein [unclassified Streptomyces]|uniref:CHAT domain-containing protein n=1 Tax=unclassified Streptomyces TaxID=2593676 RepID=UPI00278BEEEA|nr:MULTISPECIES: CHAT domain-containing protein [unclassified Streptomyces]
MPTRLAVRTVDTTGDGFANLPEEPTHRPRDLTVRIDRCGSGFRVLLFGRAVETTPYGTHEAVLEKSQAQVEQLADDMRRVWFERFIGYESAPDRFPYSDGVNLTDVEVDEGELARAIGALHAVGYKCLMGLLEGAAPSMVRLRGQLVDVLRKDGLLIRFESRDVYFPWPMLCLPPRPEEPPVDGGRPPFDRFLGYRHQIEQTSCLEPPPGPPPGPSPVTPVPEASDRVRASLHTDGLDDLLSAPTAAAEVARLLSDVTRLTVRSSSEDLFADMVSPEFADELMYFWCHGQFGSPGPDGTPPAMTIKLTDEHLIDAQDIGSRMTLAREGGPFASAPFVFLNACHLGQLSSGQVHHIGMALLRHGATGVLGPQAPVPVAFAAEYALRFLKTYLDGARAGDVMQELTRAFADTYSNPLGLLYSLHSGLDSKLTRPERAL